eukprot:1559279-Pyramimonas_sp.AAC.1
MCHAWLHTQRKKDRRRRERMLPRSLATPRYHELPRSCGAGYLTLSHGISHLLIPHSVSRSRCLTA